jgi:hypothetical protein
MPSGTRVRARGDKSTAISSSQETLRGRTRFDPIPIVQLAVLGTNQTERHVRFRLIDHVLEGEICHRFLLA